MPLPPQSQSITGAKIFMPAWEDNTAECEEKSRFEVIQPHNNTRDGRRRALYARPNGQVSPDFGKLPCYSIHLERSDSGVCRAFDGSPTHGN